MPRVMIAWRAFRPTSSLLTAVCLANSVFEAIILSMISPSVRMAFWASAECRSSRASASRLATARAATRSTTLLDTLRLAVKSSKSLRPLSVRMVFSNSAATALVFCRSCFRVSWQLSLVPASLVNCSSRMATRISW